LIRLQRVARLAYSETKSKVSKNLKSQEKGVDIEWNFPSI